MKDKHKLTSETAKDLQAKEIENTSQNDQEPFTRRRILQKSETMKPRWFIGKPFKDHLMSMKQESSTIIVKRKEVPHQNEPRNTRSLTPRRPNQVLAKNDQAIQPSHQNMIKKDQELYGQQHLMSWSGKSTETREHRDSIVGRHLSLGRLGLQTRQSANKNQNNENRFSKTHREKREEKPENYKEPEKIKKINQDTERKEKISAPIKLSREYSEGRKSLKKSKPSEGGAKQEQKIGSLSPERFERRGNLSKYTSNEGREKREKKTGSVISEQSGRRESLSKSKAIEDWEKKEKKTRCINLEHFGIRERLSKSENIESREKKEKKTGPVSPERYGRHESLGKSENTEGREKRPHVSCEYLKRHMNMSPAKIRKEEPSEELKDSAANEQPAYSDNELQESVEKSGILHPNNVSSFVNKDLSVTLQSFDTSENNEISRNDNNRHEREEQSLFDERHNCANSNNVELTPGNSRRSSSKDFQSSSQAVGLSNLNGKNSQEETISSENKVNDVHSPIRIKSSSTSRNSTSKDSVDRDGSYCAMLCAERSHNDHRDSLKEKVKQSKVSGLINESCMAAQETNSASALTTHTSDVSGVCIDDNRETPSNCNFDRDTDDVPSTKDYSEKFRREEDCSSLLCNDSSPEPCAFGQIESEPPQPCVWRSVDPQLNSLQHSWAPCSDAESPSDSGQPCPSICTETAAYSVLTIKSSSVMSATTVCPSDQQYLQAIPIETDCDDGPPFSHAVSETFEKDISPPYTQAAPMTPEPFNTPALQDLPLTPDSITTIQPFTQTESLKRERFFTPLKSQAKPRIVNRTRPADPKVKHRRISQSRHAEPIAFSTTGYPRTDRDWQEQSLPMHIAQDCYEDGLSMQDFQSPSQSSIEERWQFPAHGSSFVQRPRNNGLSRFETEFESSRELKGVSRSGSIASFHSCVSDFSPDPLGNLCNEPKGGFNKGSNATLLDVMYLGGSTVTRETNRGMEEIAPPSQCSSWKYLHEDFEEEEEDEVESEANVGYDYDDDDCVQRRKFWKRTRGVSAAESNSSDMCCSGSTFCETWVLRNSVTFASGNEVHLPNTKPMTMRRQRGVAQRGQVDNARRDCLLVKKRRTMAMGNHCKVEQRMSSARRFKSSHSFYDEDHEDISDYSVKSVPTETSLKSFCSEDLNQDNDALGLSSRYKGHDLEPVFGPSFSKHAHSRVENEEKLFRWNGDGRKRENVSTWQHFAPSTFSDHDFEKCPNFIELHNCNYDLLNNASFDTRYGDYLCDFDNRMDRFLRKEYTEHELQCEANLNELQYNYNFDCDFSCASGAYEDTAWTPDSHFEETRAAEQSTQLQKPVKQKLSVEMPLETAPFPQHIALESSSVEELPVESSSVEELPVESSSIEQLPFERSSVEQLPFESSSVEQLPFESSSIEKLPVEDSSVEQLPLEDSSVEQLPVESSSVEQRPLEDSSVEQLPLEDSSVEQLPVEDSSVEQLPVEDSSVEQLPVEDSFVEQLPVEDSSVEQLPVESSYVEQLPVESSSVEQRPLEVSAVEQLPVESSYMKQRPLKDSSVEQLPLESSFVEELPLESSSIEQLPFESSSVEQLPVESSSIQKLPFGSSSVEQLPEVTDYTPQMVSPDRREEPMEWTLEPVSTEAQLFPAQAMEDKRQDVPKAADEVPKEQELDAKSLEYLPIITTDTGKTMPESRSDPAFLADKLKTEIKARKRNYEEMATEQFSVFSNDSQTIAGSVKQPGRRRTILDSDTTKAAMKTAADSQRIRKPTAQSAVQRPSLDVQKVIAEQKLVSFTIPQVSTAPPPVIPDKNTGNVLQIQFNKANLEKVDESLIHPTEELLVSLQKFSQSYRFRETSDMYTILSQGRALAAALEDFFQLFPSEESLQMDVPEVPGPLKYSSPLPQPTRWQRKAKEYRDTPEQDSSRRQAGMPPIVEDRANASVLSLETLKPSIPVTLPISKIEQPKTTKSHQSSTSLGERRSSLPTSSDLLNSVDIPNTKQTKPASRTADKPLQETSKQAAATPTEPDEQVPLIPSSPLQPGNAMRPRSQKTPQRPIENAIKSADAGLADQNKSKILKQRSSEAQSDRNVHDSTQGSPKTALESEKGASYNDTSQRLPSGSKEPVSYSDATQQRQSGSKEQLVSSSDVGKSRRPISDSKQPVSSSAADKRRLSDSKQPVLASDAFKSQLSNSKPVSSGEVSQSHLSDFMQPDSKQQVLSRKSSSLSDEKARSQREEPTEVISATPSPADTRVSQTRKASSKDVHPDESRVLRISDGQVLSSGGTVLHENAADQDVIAISSKEKRKVRHSNSPFQPPDFFTHIPEDPTESKSKYPQGSDTLQQKLMSESIFPENDLKSGAPTRSVPPKTTPEVQGTSTIKPDVQSPLFKSLHNINSNAANVNVLKVPSIPTNGPVNAGRRTTSSEQNYSNRIHSVGNNNFDFTSGKAQHKSSPTNQSSRCSHPNPAVTRNPEFRPSPTRQSAKFDYPDVPDVRQMNKQLLVHEKQLDKHRLTTPRTSKQEVTRTFDSKQKLADRKPPTLTRAAVSTATEHDKNRVIYSEKRETVSGFNDRSVKSLSPKVSLSKNGSKNIATPVQTSSKLKAGPPKSKSRDRTTSGSFRHPKSGEKHTGHSAMEHKTTHSVPLSDQPGKHLNESFIFVPNPALLSVSSPVLMGKLLHTTPPRVSSSPSLGMMLDIQWENPGDAPLGLRPILKQDGARRTSKKLDRVFFNPEVEVLLFSDDDEQFNAAAYDNSYGADYAT